MLGEEFDKLGEHVSAKPEDLAFTQDFWKLTAELFSEGALKPHPVEVGEHGLVGVFDGMDLSRKGKVSGKKLVYRISDTPDITGSA